MQSFYQRFRDSASRHRSLIAVEIQLAQPNGKVISFTFGQLQSMAESVGNWVAASGVPPGSRCALLGANHPHWVAAYLGCVAAGCVAVPLDSAYKPEQVAKLLTDSGSALLFTDTRHLETAKEAVALLHPGSVRMVMLDEPAHGYPCVTEMFTAGPGSFQAMTEVGDDALAVMLYTSGTTSDPKGVMLTHANLQVETDSVLKVVNVTHTDAILGVLPLFHALAQMANLLIPFAVGCRVIYLEQLNTGELLLALRERNATLFCCVPQFFYLIHEKIFKQVQQSSRMKRIAFSVLMKLSRAARNAGINLGKLFFAKAHEALGTKIRYLITGGSRFDPQIGRDLETLGFDIVQAYGLTECSGAGTISTPGTRFIGSVGRAIPGLDVKIADAEMEVQPGPNGETVGEVWLRGPIIMQGYWNRPDATAEVIEDGWLRTGDLGYLNAQRDLFITGRKKEVIVLSSGKNIHPEEIEAHYLQSPWIREICVMGIESRPGEPFSERLHAVIVPNMDVVREKKIVNMREVIRFDVEGFSAKLASTKRILSYEIWLTELPRTTTRKLKRHEILAQVEAKMDSGGEEQEVQPKPQGIGASSQEREWLQHPEVTRAMQVVHAAAKHDRAVQPTDNLELDLGLDSMERVELVVALEQALNAKADEALISEVYTVRELIEAVRAGIGAHGARLRAGWEEVFATESTDPEVLAVAEDRPIASRIWFAFGCFVSLFNHLFFRLEITGLEKLPEKGPFILAPNHQSFIDAPLLIAELPYRLYKDLFYVGTSEIFGSGPMRRLARSLKLVPVDPDANLVPAMRAGSYGLKRGKILVLYPEGERSIDGSPKLFKKGAAILAAHHHIPIYPVALEGFHESWPRGKGFQRFHKLRIAVGDPIQPRIDVANPERAYEQTTAELRDRVLQLWRPLHEKNVGRTNSAAAD
jgi:long-chain acyl-CoA synthetase